MNMDFSIELSAERIDNPLTKEYFREVASSYAAGNYRSAVVMLWTTVVCDLVYKLQELRDLHQDGIAKVILKEMEDLQAKNPRSPDWEPKLLEAVRTRTKLLDPGDTNALEQIQQMRHLCAHPVLHAQELLFQPSRDAVRAHIRGALESLLLKPPIFARDVVKEFVTSLAAKKALLPDDASLERYLSAKYFPRIHKEIEDRLFRTLWRFCFYTDNVDTNAHRDINLRALSILYRRRPDAVIEKVRAERNYFSEVGEGDRLVALGAFLAERPLLVESLTDVALVPLRNAAKGNLDLFTVCWFLNADLETHARQVVKQTEEDPFGAAPSPEAWAQLVSVARSLGRLDAVIRAASDLYAGSLSYDSADDRFAAFIVPLLGDMSAEQLVALVGGAEVNGQACDRRRSGQDHAQVIRAIRAKGGTIDLKDYPRFSQSVPQGI